MTVYKGRDLSVLPQGTYSVVVADPPWSFLTRSKKGMGRSPDMHYDTMTLDDIKAMPVRALCESSYDFASSSPDHPSWFGRRGRGEYK